ncbi:MAG: type II secretory ATPase GspE/PulE/Tfp pilus assembly ATPase PilB-like protein [Chlamydiales bacterium]|jgi:type II secretory ATPase GspE/PulE/Tfp pilus assembly ATPase PilB-like protein
MPQSPDPLAPGFPSPTAQRLEALVSIGAESADKVELSAGRGRASMQVRSIRGGDIELTGNIFLPRTVQVAIELHDGPLAEGQIVSGSVRKVQLVGSDPNYRIWVQLDQAGAAALAEVAIGGTSEAVAHEQVEIGNALDALPEWATSLVEEEVVTLDQMLSISTSADSDDVLLENALIASATVLEEVLTIHMALCANVPYVDPRAYEVQLKHAAQIPENLAREHGIFPLFRLGEVLIVGMRDPSDLAVIDLVRLRTSCQVEACMCPASTLTSLIERAYHGSAGKSSPSQTEAGIGTLRLEAPTTTENAIVKLVRALVEESARAGASDVHIEPERDRLRVRIRVDGILVEKSIHRLEQHALIVSRIKVLSKLDIADARRPQDGNFSLQVDAGNIDVRVSTIPTVYGENVVLRLLMSDEGTVELEDLGMSKRVLETFESFLAQPNGMILVTGPTGSGKTTTLYAALARLCSVERNVVTVEDPVEKRLPLLRQTQVNPKAGITFATGLRSLLRQDPDVIMLGEIRDRETADIAVQAALTGHLVLSTLHTNTAAGAIVRLSEMKIPPFLITSSLQAVLSQRLARRICPNCAHEVDPDPQLLKALNVEVTQGTKFNAGAGCGRCFQTGYKGRVALYELLHVTPRLSDALLGEGSRDTLEHEAASALVGSMWEDGLSKVRAGQTTLEEVLRIVGVQHGQAGKAPENTQ